LASSKARIAAMKPVMLQRSPASGTAVVVGVVVCHEQVF
jgi:hypothetical protein